MSGDEVLWLQVVSNIKQKLAHHQQAAHRQLYVLCRKAICMPIFCSKNCYTHTHTHTFNGPLSGTTQVSRYQKGKTNLDFTEARGSGISWAICKSAPLSRQITTPAPHRSVFYRPDALSAA